MNHRYQIVTEEVKPTSPGQRQFVAHVTNIYMEIDGKHIEVAYPDTQFEGATYASAMLKANDAFKEWLGNFERQ